MSLASISIKRPVFAWMLMIALIVFGGIAFTRLGVSQFPDIDLPVVTISLSLPGAAPEVMESDVVDPVESAVIQVEGLVQMSSTCRHCSRAMSSAAAALATPALLTASRSGPSSVSARRTAA